MPLGKKYNWNGIKDVIASLTELTNGSALGSIGVTVTEMNFRYLWDKYNREIEVHSKGYVMPKITKARPNENPESTKNRLLNYEPITTPFWNEALVKMKRILLASSADVLISEKTGDYIKRPNFYGLSLYDFFATEGVEKTINEPNGLTVVYPLKFIEKYKIDNPVQFVCHTEVVYMSIDTVIFVCLDRSEYTMTYDPKTMLDEITYNVKSEKTFDKRVYHIFTKTGSKVEFAEVKDRDVSANEWIFDVYKTDLDFLPCFQNGGIYVDKFVYKSFFHNAIGFGNKALNRASDNDAVDAMYSYPITEMVADECNTCNGVGKIRVDNVDKIGFTEESCKTCKGTGEVVVMSPYKVMMRKRAQSNADPLDTNIPAVQFYSPDIAILQHSATNWQDYLEKFKTSLHVIARRDTKQAESGFSIEKQYEPLYDFMHNVGMTLYNNLETILKALQGYLDPKAETPSVTRPISYHLVEEGEAFTVLATFIEKDMPTYLRRQYIRNFISKYMGAKSPVLRYMEILEKIDPFLFYSTTQKQALLVSGAMNKEQYRISNASFGVLMPLMSELKYKDAETEVIEKEILTRISAFTVDPVLTPVVQTI